MSASTRNKRPAPMGPKALEGSAEAKRLTCVLLETLGGMLGPQEASERMGVSLTRYYQLETRVLQSIVAALEPRPRGRPRRDADRVKALEVERDELRRDLLRTQSMMRALQRGLVEAGPGKPAARKTKGSKAPSSKAKSKKKTRRRRKVSRGERVRRELDRQIEAPSAAGASDAPTQGGDA